MALGFDRELTQFQMIEYIYNKILEEESKKKEGKTK